jgi:hypothetical protein
MPRLGAVATLQAVALVLALGGCGDAPPRTTHLLAASETATPTDEPSADADAGPDAGGLADPSDDGTDDPSSLDPERGDPDAAADAEGADERRCDEVYGSLCVMYGVE